MVVEIESAPLAGSWVKETAVSGYTGSCYYTWNKGTPSSITSAGEGVLTYKIKITNAGNYYFRWHNYHNYPADNTLENDSWLKVDNGSWVKCFQNSGNSGYWNWVCKLEPSHGVFEDPNYNLSAGYHTIQISGRSYRHSIDRFHLSKDRANLDKRLPESPREGEPIDTTDITAIVKPAAGATLSEGQTYQLIGRGKNLSWSYDANSDGLAEVDIADGDTVDFKIPTGITGPREITITLTGDNGTDQILCKIGDAGINDLLELADHGLQIGTGPEGIRLALDKSSYLTISVVSLNGKPAARLLQGNTRAGIYSFHPDLPAGIHCLFVSNGQDINLVHMFTVVK